MIDTTDYSRLHKHNYTWNIEVCTVEDYMWEIDEDMEGIERDYGGDVKYFIRAKLDDDETEYSMRLFGPVYTNTYIGHMQATIEVTTRILEDYFAHLDGVYNKKIDIDDILGH